MTKQVRPAILRDAPVFHLASKQNPGAKTYVNLVYTVLVLVITSLTI